MTDTGVRFVQFPHPGGEHNPPDHEMPWNVAGHRRKFLIAPGDYVDADDRHDDVEVVFWGEWEPPSRIERLNFPHSRGQCQSWLNSVGVVSCRS